METAFYPLICKTCEKVLKKPVILTCGHSICQLHVDEAKTANRDVKCVSCTESHTIPENGFTLIKDLEALIENKLDSLNLGKDYNYAYNKSRAFANFVKRFETTKNQPEMRIHDYISGVRNKIDLKREELKKEIDKKCLSMIEKLDELEKECMANVDLVKSRFDEKLDEKLSEWKTKSEQFSNDLRSFESSKWKKVREEVDSHIKEVRSELYDLYESLFLNRFNEIDIPKWGISEVFDTLSIEVEGLSKIKEDISKSVENLEPGLRFYVEIKKRDWTKKEFWVGINLESRFGNSIRKPRVEYEVAFLNRFDENNSLKRSYVNEFLYYGNGYSSILMKLDDLLNNNDLYNPEKDSFKAQVIIKKVEWIKPY